MIEKNSQVILKAAPTHFKLYKAGKIWLISGLAVAAFYTGVAGQMTNAHADVQPTVTQPALTKAASAATLTPTSGASTATVNSTATSSANVATSASSTAGSLASAGLSSATVSQTASSQAVSVGSVIAAQPMAASATPVATPTPASQLTTNIKDRVTVPASYLANAQYPGPFTAGVNQQIPFNAFGGDGMLTRLLLKAADSAPWSDNGVAKNSALLPIEANSDQYTYEVDLNGNTVGKTGQALLDQLKANGEMAYDATVKVFTKGDDTTPTATKSVTINLTSLTDNIKQTLNVPANYLAAANYPGPFTAGVNQVIPFNAFGGDGMLTRLLLTAADGAPWSDNGAAKNPALLPIAANADEFFYEVDLNGNTAGKSGQALLDQLKANGTMTYNATVKVYGMKNGQADLTNLLGTKMVQITLNGAKSTMAGDGQSGSAANEPSAAKPGSAVTDPVGSVATRAASAAKQHENAMAGERQVSIQVGSNMEQSGTGSTLATTSTKINTMTHAKMTPQKMSTTTSMQRQLPHTDADKTSGWGAIELAILSGLAGLAGVLGLRKRR